MSLSDSILSSSTEVALETRPLSDALGVEVLGLDLRQPQDAATIAALRSLWQKHLVLVLRDQRISAADQMRFCEYFGPVGRRTRPAEERAEPDGTPDGMMYVSNVRVDGKLIGSLPDGEMNFHIDQCYTERPALGTALFAIEVPKVGGDTLFSNLIRAYESLPEAIRSRVDGRKAVHFYDYTSQQRSAVDSARDDIKHFAHPIVCTDPASGRKSLFVCRLMTQAIEGLDTDQSDQLLQALFEAIERPEFIYAHKWRTGDLLLWHNRFTAHARTDFDPAERRHLRRFTITGERPV